jgi:hypothetical protein
MVVFSSSSGVNLNNSGEHIFQKSKSHLKILRARRVTWSKFHSEDPRILSATVKKFSRQGALAPITCEPLPNMYHFQHSRHHSPTDLEQTAPLKWEGVILFRIIYLTHLMDYRRKMYKETRQSHYYEINKPYTQKRTEVTKKEMSF